MIVIAKMAKFMRGCGRRRAHCANTATVVADLCLGREGIRGYGDSRRIAPYDDNWTNRWRRG
jgi:hypothetical protein